MNSKEYEVIRPTQQRKRVCLTLDLKDDSALIEQYKFHHKPENNWKEINDGMRKAGILLMDIYWVETRMFMICEVEIGADFDACWNKVGTYPRQDEWAELMATFQQALPGFPLQWVKMERVYSLDEAPE